MGYKYRISDFLTIQLFIMISLSIFTLLHIPLWKQIRASSWYDKLHRHPPLKRVSYGRDHEPNVLQPAGISSEQLLLFMTRRLKLEATCRRLKQFNNVTRTHENNGKDIINLNYAFQVKNDYYNPKSWVHYNSMFYVGRSRREKPRTPVQLDWCPIYKASSSTWLTIFCHLHGAINPVTQPALQNHSLPLLDLAYAFHVRVNPPSRPAKPHQLIMHQTNRHLIPYYQMLIVRHPFERLVSAYRNRVENIAPGQFYTAIYGYSFVKQFRKPNASGLYDENPTTFPELVSHVIKEGEVDPNKLDVHWMPIYASCPPCHFTYNLILKVETMASDMDAVFQLLGFSSESEEYKELLEIWNPYSNSADVKDKNSLMRKYFSQVSRENIWKLYKLYEMDFMMFSYSAKEYIQMGYRGSL